MICTYNILHNVFREGEEVVKTLKDRNHNKRKIRKARINRNLNIEVLENDNYLSIQNR